MTSLIFFAFLGVSVYLKWLSLEVLVVYLVVSAVSFCVYGIDKTAAKRGRRRTRESFLHILGLLGGWPGAWLAQRMFHHKSRKFFFQLMFWITVGVNCAVLAWFLHATI